jgi:hypothetical protein
MKFSFGIITGGSKNHRESKDDDEVANRIRKIIESIKIQDIPDVEIVVVGGKNLFHGLSSVKHIEFDESLVTNWITKKKNIITCETHHENIVYMHDYFSLDEDWYKGMISFDKSFHILMNRIVDINGDRFHDWSVYPSSHPWFTKHDDQTFLPYDVNHMSKYQYISGGYWIAKRHVMQEFPLNESLTWGQGEDVEWSLRVLQKYNFTMNEDSIVRLLKPRFASNWKVVGEEGMKIVESLKNNV